MLRQILQSASDHLRSIQAKRRSDQQDDLQSHQRQYF